ncbi:MAG TPA: flagellar type III secretion system pore protein FliP [Terriglobia bacterium]|nr:flagellar type III secretion system pore protein FliP [Terriglobia bacterium]
MKRLAALLLLGALLFGAVPSAAAQQASPLGGNIRLDVKGGGGDQSYSMPIQVLLFLTVMTFIPAVLISLTSFTRIIIVFHFLRQALGTNETPSNQIIIGLTLFLTLFIMTPVGEQINRDALGPMMDGKISQTEALGRAVTPLRGFMMKYTREKDLALFLAIAKRPRPRVADDVPTTVLIPAFMISELKTSFQIGFVLFLPFLVIDMVVATVLLSMGMMQLPPVMVSIPFKILLFIMVDGWNLVVGSLVKSFY